MKSCASLFWKWPDISMQVSAFREFTSELLCIKVFWIVANSFHLLYEKKLYKFTQPSKNAFVYLPLFGLDMENTEWRTVSGNYSLVMRQKDESQNGCNIVWVSGGKKYSFFGKFGVFCFVETPVLSFVLLPYYRRKYILFFQETNAKSLCLLLGWYINNLDINRIN